eukprot:154454_1
MDPFRVWLKVSHDFRLMNDDEFSEIEQDLLDLFGGIRGVIQKYLLKILPYNELLQISSIIENNCGIIQNDDEKEPRQRFSLANISDNSLCKIYAFLPVSDRINLQCTNTVLYFAAFYINTSIKNKAMCVHNIQTSNDDNIILTNLNKITNASLYSDGNTHSSHIYCFLIKRFKEIFLSNYPKFNNDTINQELTLKSLECLTNA